MEARILGITYDMLYYADDAIICSRQTRPLENTLNKQKESQEIVG